MTRWIVPAFLFVTLGSHAHAGELPLNFAFAREGTPPSMTPAEFTSAKGIVVKELAQFRGQFINSASSVVKTDMACRRYARATLKTLWQLRQSLENLAGNAALDTLNDEEFQVRMRFELLHYANLNLYALFHKQSEKDFSNFDSSVHSACAFENRAALSRGYDQLILDSNVLRIRGFGAAGLETLDRATDRWIKIAQATAARRNVHSEILTAVNVATIAGVFFMPALAGRIPFLIEEMIGRFVLPSVPLQTGALLRPIELGLFVADFGGNYALSNHLQPEEDKREANYGFSWEDTLNQVELLINSPLDYAQQGLAYLGEVKSETAKLVHGYLEQNAKDLRRTYGTQFDQTAALDFEGLVLGNRPISDQLQRLEDILNDHYGYQVTCRQGSYKNLYLGSVNDLNCFAALRRFARLVYNTSLPVLSVAGRLALSFEFNDYASTFDERAEPFHATINASVDSDQLLRFVRGVVYHPALNQRLLDDQRLSNLANNFALNTGIALSSDNALLATARWKGLTNLAAIAERDPGLLELTIDEIRLQSTFETLADHGQRLRLGIAANATVDEIKTFLRAQATNPERTARIATFTREYAEVQTLLDRIKSRGFDAKCSTAGELTLAACLKTLVVVDQILAQSSPKYLRSSEIRSIMVYGREEMAIATDVKRFGDSEMWDVRERTTSFELILFLREHGWIHAPSSPVCDIDGDAKPCLGGH